MTVTPPVALTIAGSDSGGGAGLQADLRTFTACGVHGCVAVTAVTVQNSLGVTGIVEIPPATVADQVRAVATDIGVAAAKTGMLASAAIISAVAEVCDEVGIGAAVPLVVDPVAASMHGDPLLADDALTLLRSELVPRATLVTPNLDEVRLLVGIEVRSRAEQYEAACALHALGPQWVLVKGGHLHDDPECLDLLYDGSQFTAFTGPRLETPHTHGSGDTLAAAITSALARGAAIPQAVGYGKRYIEQAVAHAYPLGSGVGPVSPFWRLRPPWASDLPFPSDRGTSRSAPADDDSGMPSLPGIHDKLVAEPPLEVQTATMGNAGHPVRPGGLRPSVDELFRDTEPVRSAEDLARDGVFAEGEVEEFLADLYAMRRSDVA